MDRDTADPPAFLHHQDGFTQFGGLDGGATAGWAGADDNEIMSSQHGPIRHGRGGGGDDLRTVGHAAGSLMRVAPHHNQKAWEW